MTAAHYPCLAGRVVFITGGASGIGEGLVRAFAAQHAKVGFVDINEAAGHGLVAQLEASASPPGQGQTLFQVCDVTDTAALQAAVLRVRQSLGPVSVLVNNAASDQRHTIEEVTPAYILMAMRELYMNPVCAAC